VAFEPTAERVWRRLSREDRHAAAAFFWKEPPQEILASALAAIVSARRLRPQVARTLPEEARAQALGAILEPGEPLAAGLLVALHLGARRSLLAAFLDALGLPHENGLIQEEAEGPSLPEPVIQAAARSLLGRFPRDHVEAYLNTLWLQDPERWEALPRALEGA
jgi:hypothetical protein